MTSYWCFTVTLDLGGTIDQLQAAEINTTLITNNKMHEMNVTICNVPTELIHFCTRVSFLQIKLINIQQ